MTNKPYHREISSSWFMKLPFYRMYMLREATAIFLFIYTINLICGLKALSNSKEAWSNWVACQSNPLMIIIAILTLVMSLYHSYTWFNTTPKVMPLQQGAKKVPVKTIVTANWIAFAVVSLIAIILAAI